MSSRQYDDARYKRHRWVYRDPRWEAVRLVAKRRDDWKCVECGSKYRLQVDHITPITEAPELAFTLSNLQTLCGRCHGRKTHFELGGKPIAADRNDWLDNVKDYMRKTS